MLAAFVVVLMSSSPAAPPGLCTPLQVGVLKGDQEAVQRLAGRRLLGMGAPSVKLEERGLDPGTCFQRTALMIAAEHGQLTSAQVLISSGANLNATALLPELGEGEVDARCLAIANGHKPVVALLDKSGAQRRPCTENALLFAAIKASDVDDVERQLRAHPSHETLTAALKSAIGKRTGKILALLVQAGLDTRLDFASVFDAAITLGDIDMVNQLSSGGAKVTGGYLLSQAISLRRSGALASLIVAGARTDTDEVRSAVLEAVREQESAVLRTLLSAGYRGDEQIPLMLHAVRHYPRIVPDLVRAGVAVELDDETGATPLMVAAAANETKLVQLLLDGGASARTGDIACDTAFDSARAPKSLRQLLKLPPSQEQPVLPGRAARRMGITCGAARLSITFDPGFEVYLPTGQLPMHPAMEYRVEPGVHELRVRDLKSGSERRMVVTLSPGLNSFTEKFFDFMHKGPDLAPGRHPAFPPVRQTLSPANIFEVVNQHKADLQKCVVEQRRRSPKLTGKLVMRWSINTDGEVSDVAPTSKEFASTYLAACLTGLIELWKFPEHRLEGEPVVFPFKF